LAQALRVLLSDNESLFVNHIRGLVRPRLKSEELIRDLDFVHDQWKLAVTGAEVAINLNDQPVLPETAWNLYVNSYFAHYDIEKRQALELDQTHDSAWMIRWRFLEHIHHAAQYVIGVAIVIRQALENDALNFSND
jgi:hypothetical protein